MCEKQGKNLYSTLVKQDICVTVEVNVQYSHLTFGVKLRQKKKITSYADQKNTVSKSLPPETPTVGKAGNHLRLDRPCLDTSAVNSLVAFAPLSLAAWKQHPWSEILPAEEERNACEIATVKSDKVTKIIHLSKTPIVGQKKFQAKVAWFVNKNDFDKPLSPKKIHLIV